MNVSSDALNTKENTMPALPRR